MASLAVAVTVVVDPEVLAANVTVAPPPGPVPVVYQSVRLGDHS